MLITINWVDPKLSKENHDLDDLDDLVVVVVSLCYISGIQGAKVGSASGGILPFDYYEYSYEPTRISTTVFLSEHPSNLEHM